ncbi:unnamed protein product [Brachionus calyciflorus]|uniref:MULE transposase domain-containing protein n=1 Tax=Brachionus calyciflorus TaxID=104777 RepID=A0A814CCJ8_9BILA|nr:unnamed protein product [Brachionus calyciflorus]
MIPCVFILMDRRRTVDYEEILDAIIKEAKVHNFVLNPKQIMMDFEQATIKAFTNKFPEIKSKGCLFHLGQSIFRKFTKLGFKTDYDENSEVNNWFRRLFSLAMIPLNQVETQWQNILTDQPVFEEDSKNKKMEKFLDYFAFVGVAHPNIFKSIDVFQKQETAAFVKYQHAIQGKPAPPRKKLEIFKDNQIKTYKKMLIENDLTLDRYVKYVMPLFIFRKTKNVSENESDISDSEEENGDLSSDDEETFD